MTVSQLIEKLQEMPQNVDVRLWTAVDAELEIKLIPQSNLVEECVMIIPHY